MFDVLVVLAYPKAIRAQTILLQSFARRACARASIRHTNSLGLLLRHLRGTMAIEHAEKFESKLNFDDAGWEKRLKKRLRVFKAQKASYDYTRVLVAASVDEAVDARRPQSPDPRDRTASKRQWESSMRRWRLSLRILGESV